MRNAGKFHAWVRAYGVTALARDLQVIPRTIYWWLNARPDGHQVHPRVEHAQRMVELSKGKLKLDDILNPPKPEVPRG